MSEQSELKSSELDSGVAKAAAWSCLGVYVGIFVALLVLMRFFPPPSPGLSARQFADLFIARRNEVRLGSLVMIISWTFFATWAMSITVFVRKMERSWPILTYISITLIGSGTVFFLVMPVTWAAMAFRPESLDPSILQVMNDWVWFAGLFTWPPFSLFMVVIGVAVLRDHNVPTLFPRWVAYLCFWCAVGESPLSLIIFVHNGIFAYTGLIGWWIPIPVFCIGMITMTVVTVQAINKQKRSALAGQQPPVPSAV
jgi:hypothetical protein